MREPSPFLTAQWRNLAVVNFDVEPDILRPFVPAKTELDFWHARTFLSVVGFQFIDTRVWGLPIPFHRTFDEVNLRFYVRRKTAEGWRRAVVFVRELAPRRAIAWTARLLFGENYLTVPVRHRIDAVNGDPRAVGHVAYAWTLDGRRQRLEMTVAGEGRLAEPGSLEEFVIEHYWGYSGGAGRPTIEYRVDHPRWKLWPAREARFEADIETLYGERFVAALSAPPANAFLADGSAVTMYGPVRIHAGRELELPTPLPAHSTGPTSTRLPSRSQ
jgi:uncharacterized protein YqjF (DUF2071 family)